jgi:hypothetical protein
MLETNAKANDYKLEILGDSSQVTGWMIIVYQRSQESP